MLLMIMMSPNCCLIPCRTQLRALMDTIRSTTPHFVRCLKPNHISAPDELDRHAIVAQLRYSGVLEAARVSRLGIVHVVPRVTWHYNDCVLCAGFPIRMSHAEFASRYRPLGIGIAAAPLSRQHCVDLLKCARTVSIKDCQVGSTKVFMRSGTCYQAAV